MFGKYFLVSDSDSNFERAWVHKNDNFELQASTNTHFSEQEWASIEQFVVRHNTILDQNQKSIKLPLWHTSSRIACRTSRLRQANNNASKSGRRRTYERTDGRNAKQQQHGKKERKELASKKNNTGKSSKANLIHHLLLKIGPQGVYFTVTLSLCYHCIFI